MSRYFTRPQPKAIAPRAAWYDDTPLLPALTVDDHETVHTGLVDKHGDPILRAPNPIGFGCDL